MEEDRRMHWETVYETKEPNQVSWTQEVPKTSLSFINSFGLSKTARIIDVGGGDSNLVDFLLKEGYENITVLDISEKAILRAKKRLGINASKVNWVVSDITEFKPDAKFDIWHDRAAFHFLTANQQIEKYLAIAKDSVDGNLIIGTFSKEGPTRCSGLEIKQYNEKEIVATFNNGFEMIECVMEDHTTPFETIQNFIFCSFKKCEKNKINV